ASRGVTVRDWSPFASPSRRMPGVTSAKPGPAADRIAGASCAEHTTPSSPLSRARRARCIAFSSAVPEKPIAGRSASPRLVRMVTPMRSGGWAAPAIASRAARIIATPPLAWMFIIQTPRRAAARQAPATVLGMSWNLRSRKTWKPRSWSCVTTAGPAATKSSLPTFTRQSFGSRRAASASASRASGTSRATITGFAASPPGERISLTDLHPREVASGALELRRAARREGLPSAARRALPEELPRLEAAIGAEVHGERLRVGMHEVLHELQVLPALGGRAHQLRVDQAIEAHERGIAAHLVADQAPRGLVAFVLRGGLVDDVEEVEPRIAVLQP